MTTPSTRPSEAEHRSPEATPPPCSSETQQKNEGGTEPYRIEIDLDEALRLIGAA